jgi:hypothetical protein
MAVATSPAPESGRRRSRGRPPRTRPNRFYGAVAGLVLLAAAVGAQNLIPTPVEEERTLTYTGAMKDEVSAHRFAARVDSITAARSLRLPESLDGPKKIPTDHLFLIVKAGATVPRDPINIGATLVSGGDDVYAATDKVPSDLTLLDTFIQPGWWTTGLYFFEVPQSALAGARIRMSPPVEVITESQRPEAEIDLGLDDAGVRDLVAKAADTYDLARN